MRKKTEGLIIAGKRKPSSQVMNKKERNEKLGDRLYKRPGSDKVMAAQGVLHRRAPLRGDPGVVHGRHSLCGVVRNPLRDMKRSEPRRFSP